MKKITICLDVDGVVTDIASGIENSLTKMGLPEMDYTHWLVQKYEDDLTLSVFNNKPFWLNLKPYEDSWYQMNYWWSKGIDIHLVTGRYSNEGKTTLIKWLDNWKIAYTSVHFAELGSKIDIIRNLNCSFMVEDNFNEIESLTSHGVKCFMRKQWYNKDYWGKYNSIDTLFDIKELND